MSISSNRIFSILGVISILKKIQIPLKNISIKNIETVNQPAIIVNNVNMDNKHIVLITLICLWWLTSCKNIFWKPESHRGSCTNVLPFILLILIQSTDVRCDSIQDMIQDSQSKHCRTMMCKVQTLNNNYKCCCEKMCNNCKTENRNQVTTINWPY